MFSEIGGEFFLSLLAVSMSAFVQFLGSTKLAFAAAVLACLALTPLARTIALWLNIVDNPDGGRKCHGRPVPLWGGVAVYAALVAGLLAARATLPASEAFDQLSTTVILACGLVCLVGCVDDSRDLNARFKLLLQVLSVMPVVMAGYAFDRVVAFGYPIDFGWLGIPLTVLWLVGCINALNLLDGLDGLASVVGISAALMMAVIASTTGHPHVAVVAIVVAGALSGFLAYNLPPASIFLGDSGSMVIGLVVGMISIQGALKTSATLSLTVPAVVMSIPMLDTFFAIVRRKLSGQRFDEADRGHIHHRLLERGLTNWQALLTIGALCLTTGAAATAATLLRLDAVAWITAVVLIVLLVRTRAFGHYEVALAKQQFNAAIERGTAAITRQWNGTAPALEWADAWRALVAELAANRTGGFELLLANRGTQVRYSWRNAATPHFRYTEPRVIQTSGQQATFGQLQLLGIVAGEGVVPAATQLSALLDSLAERWEGGEVTQPPAELGIQWHRVTVDLGRRAA